MFGVDPDIGSSALRLWVAAGSAALLVFVCALAFDWTRTRTVARVGVVVLGAVLGATLAWSFLDAASVRDRSAERRALESRAAALTAESLMPGSSLACLDGLAGDDVEAACEKALFASPATVAGATAFVAARLSLLADIVAYTKRGGGSINAVLLPLRHSLETDRFGFVAHTLAVADRCSSDHCAALALLDNSGRVRANLSGQTLERYLDRYLTVWAQSPGTPVADATSTGATQQSPPHKLVDIDFPSAASIPPISIMNPEPPGPPAAAAVAAATAGEAKTESKAASKTEPKAHEVPAAARRVQKKPPLPPPAQAATAAPAVDPVWQPQFEQPAAAPAAAAAQSSGAPQTLGPVQLNPFPPPPAAAAPSKPQ
jgi:hypothetical protein